MPALRANHHASRMTLGAQIQRLQLAPHPLRVPSRAHPGRGPARRPAETFLPMPASIRRIFAGVLLATLLGCDLGEYVRPGPGPDCREVGALCELESGPLGVCESRPCRSGETPPCLVCTPQH